MLVNKAVVEVGDKDKAGVGGACTRPGSESLHKAQLDLSIDGLHSVFRSKNGEIGQLERDRRRDDHQIIATGSKVLP